MNDGKSISVEKKTIDEKYFHLIFTVMPNPIQLILNSCMLLPHQLEMFLTFTSVQILRMSFTKCNK